MRKPLPKIILTVISSIIYFGLAAQAPYLGKDQLFISKEMNRFPLLSPQCKETVIANEACYICDIGDESKYVFVFGSDNKCRMYSFTTTDKSFAAQTITNYNSQYKKNDDRWEFYDEGKHIRITVNTGTDSITFMYSYID